MRRMSAIANANKDVVYSNVYQRVITFVFTYHALLTTLFAVCPLDIKHKNFASIITRHPDSFSCLLAAVILIHYIKLSVEQKIENSA